MKAWLQSSDFTSVDLVLDEDGAIRTLQTHDWARELQQQSAREAEGQEHCPAGLGLVRDDGRTLHLCPSGSTLTLHFMRPIRHMGFLWKRHETLTIENVPLAHGSVLVRDFFACRDESLERLR